MGGLNRTIVITTLSLRTLRQRAGASTVAVVGVAGVVLVFVAVLLIAEGFQAAHSGAGSPDTAIVMRGGSDSELSSALALADTRIVMDAAGVRRADGGPVALAAELARSAARRRPTPEAGPRVWPSGELGSVQCRGAEGRTRRGDRCEPAARSPLPGRRPSRVGLPLARFPPPVVRPAPKARWTGGRRRVDAGAGLGAAGRRRWPPPRPALVP